MIITPPPLHEVQQETGHSHETWISPLLHKGDFAAPDSCVCSLQSAVVCRARLRMIMAVLGIRAGKAATAPESPMAMSPGVPKPSMSLEGPGEPSAAVSGAVEAERDADRFPKRLTPW